MVERQMIYPKREFRERESAPPQTEESAVVSCPSSIDPPDMSISGVALAGIS